MKLEELQLGRKVGPSILPIIIGAAVFSISTLIWIVNYFFPIITTASVTGGNP